MPDATKSLGETGAAAGGGRRCLVRPLSHESSTSTSAGCASRSSVRAGWPCFAAVLVAVSYFCYRALGTDLLPAMDEGGFILDYIMPAGIVAARKPTAWSATSKQMLRSVPEVESNSRRTGLQLGLAAVTEANTGDISVKLKSKRSRSVDEVIDGSARRRSSSRSRRSTSSSSQVLQDMIGDLTSAPEPVEIKLFSPDPALLREWAPQGRRRDRQSCRRGRRAERHRQHHQRTGHGLPGGPGSRGARRLHAAGSVASTPARFWRASRRPPR